MDWVALPTCRCKKCVAKRAEDAMRRNTAICYMLRIYHPDAPGHPEMSLSSIKYYATEGGAQRASEKNYGHPLTWVDREGEKEAKVPHYARYVIMPIDIIPDSALECTP
jgi:hypothetical protein